MEKLILNDGTTLNPPDKNGIVEIDIPVDEHLVVGYAPFEEFEKWVASIREQIIKSSNEQAKPCPGGRCSFYEQISCDDRCPSWPPAAEL